MRFAVVGEADMVLVEALLGRPVLNAYTATVQELDAADVTLVLAFGSRAAGALVPNFGLMAMDHGRPLLGWSGRWMVMAMRAAGEDMAETIADLGKAETLLMTDGLVELVQPGPPQSDEWPPAVAFLVFDGERKTGKCILCGSGGIASYTGEGLTWKLCKVHAVSSAWWAESNLPAMHEHREIAVAASAAAKLDRTVARKQAELRDGADRLYGRRADVGGAKEGTVVTASEPDAPAEPTPADSRGGSEPESTCVVGASANVTPDDAAISSREG